MSFSLRGGIIKPRLRRRHPGLPHGSRLCSVQGIISWTRSIAYSWGKQDIAANTVNPATQGGLMPKKAIERMGYTDLAEGFKALGMGFESMFPIGKRRFPSSPEDENLPEYYGG